MYFYAARQPILDRDKKLFAYELLFRDSLDNVFPNIDENEATSKLIEGSQLGLDDITGGKPAFINFTLDTLQKRYATMLDKEQVVVEILETVQPGKRLLAIVKELKEQGYTLALDDYIYNPVWRHFYPYIDIIKVDFLNMEIEEIKQVIKDVAPYKNIKFLAEKVETHEQFQTAMDLGFEYFQGYFFSKPEVIQSKNLAPSQMTLAELLYETSKPEMDLKKISEIKIVQDNRLISIHIKGNSFLRKMVRIIVGTLVEISTGLREPLDIKNILIQKNRSFAGVTAPAKGLILVKLF